MDEIVIVLSIFYPQEKPLFYYMGFQKRLMQYLGRI